MKSFITKVRANSTAVRDSKDKTASLLRSAVTEVLDQAKLSVSGMAGIANLANSSIILAHKVYTDSVTAGMTDTLIKNVLENVAQRMGDFATILEHVSSRADFQDDLQIIKDAKKDIDAAFKKAAGTESDDEQETEPDFLRDIKKEHATGPVVYN